MGLEAGDLVPTGCYTLSCPVCVQTLAHRWGCAIGLAQPDQHVVLTQVGDSWPEVRSRVNAYRRNLHRAGLEVRDVFHIEPNPRATGHHLHMWTWSPGSSAPLNEAVVSDAAHRAGMGSHVMLSERDRPAGAPLWYGVKTVLDHPNPDEHSPQVRAFLEINGGALGHASRGFWRDEDGQPLAGVREAMSRARQRRRGAGQQYVTTHVSD